MNFNVRVKLTGPGVIPSEYERAVAREHKHLPYSSPRVSESVRGWIQWLRPYLADPFVATWTEER